MLETARLIIRQYQISDLHAFHEMNANSEVMEFFPSTMSTEESLEMFDRFHGNIERDGYGFWAVEEKESGAFIGFVGLNEPSYDLPFGPCLEIGWRLLPGFWGKGYASEAALKCLEHAFVVLKKSNIYSFTSVLNTPSEKVMQRIGMKNTNSNFLHPKVISGDRLEEHCLYLITKEMYFGKNTADSVIEDKKNSLSH